MWGIWNPENGGSHDNDEDAEVEEVVGCPLIAPSSAVSYYFVHTAAELTARFWLRRTLNEMFETRKMRLAWTLPMKHQVEREEGNVTIVLEAIYHN